MEDYYKRSVTVVVHTLRQLTKDEKNDLWVKSEDDGRDVLVQHKYQQAFPCWSNNKNKNNSSSSWTTEASRASAFVKMDHLDLADTLVKNEWSYWFPNVVAKEKTIKVLSPGSSEDNPHGTLRMVYKEMQATSPMVANRKFTLLRSSSQIDQATLVIAETSFGPKVRPTNNTYRRLPSGCLIEGITEDLSKNVGPNEDSNSTLWRSVTGSEDLKVYASLYKSSANFEVAGDLHLGVSEDVNTLDEL
ncbi:homeobox-leucine zipper protein ROC8 [Artemisia annua]|uniref:Homeobox-leucine zipper protein ROC8 n=1 Tax=Artemisia annua TaxID=35608 RepID=A0A2U1NU20_ARTAN|nr:homeobox-leucine zipper protein ROC8 [Artemisia annua]